MKKQLTLPVALLLLAGLLSGCRPSPTPAPASPSASPGQSASPSPSQQGAGSQQAPSPGSNKIGMSVTASMAKSVNASDTDDGIAQTDITVVAVVVDKEGKILSCTIDAVPVKIAFDKTGKLVTPADTVFQTKNELGEKYGMKQASGIQKEWNEQAAAFAKYVEGMTIDEVKEIKVDEKNYPTAPDLKASVTVSIGSFMKGLEKAAASAKESGAAENHKLSLGIVTTMSKSQSAASDKEGLAQADTTCVVLTRDVGGSITGCMIDGIQSKISYSTEGKITTDLTEELKTKNELKEEYGMKKASGIGKEWYEQAEAFAKYAVGKTPAEIASIAVDEQGYALSTDMKASVTIKIGDFLEAIKKASSGA
jgi:hypothetical protein